MRTAKYNAGIPQDARLAHKDYTWLQEAAAKPERLAAVERLKPIAADLGCTFAKLAIAWCLKNPNVSTVITGASRPQQVAENMNALEVLPKLTTEQMVRIETALQGN